MSTTAPLPRPTVGRILWQDAAASIATKLFASLWAAWVFATLLQRLPWTDAAQVGAIAAPNLVPFVGLATVACIPWIAWRVVRIQGVFTRGEVVSGRIDDVDVTRGTGRIVCSYLYEGEAHERRMLVKRTPEATRLRKAEPVKLVVDPGHPDRAYLIALFLPQTADTPGSAVPPT